MTLPPDALELLSWLLLLVVAVVLGGAYTLVTGRRIR